MGAEGPHSLRFEPVPASLEEARALLEAAIRRMVSKTQFARLLPAHSEKRTWLVDTTTSTNLGIIATGRKYALRMPNDEGVIVFAGKHVDYFPFPPQRNWRWLALWLLLPPVFCWLLLKAIGRLGRPRPAA